MCGSGSRRGARELAAHRSTHRDVRVGGWWDVPHVLYRCVGGWVTLQGFATRLSFRVTLVLRPEIVMLAQEMTAAIVDWLETTITETTLYVGFSVTVLTPYILSAKLFYLNITLFSLHYLSMGFVNEI